MKFLKPYFPLIFLPLLLQLFFTSCTTTQTTQKQPRRPQARLDLGGNQIKETIHFAGFVATGYDSSGTYDSLSDWVDSNLKYGQHIINLPGKGSKSSAQRLQNFTRSSFADFLHPEFDVSLELSNSKPKAFVFAIDEERLSTESIDGDQVLLADLTGQIIVFDWKDRLVLASYPLVFSAKDFYDPKQIEQKMTQLYYEGWGENSIGFLEYFFKYLEEKVSLTFYHDALAINKVGVENISIEAKALPALKAANISTENHKQKLAQRFLAYLAKNQNLAIVPYGKADSNGNRNLTIVPGGSAMAGMFADNSANSLTIPKPDFPIDLFLQGFKEVEVDRSKIDKVVAYASFLKFRVSNSDKSTIYFEDDFKKILTRHMPVSFTTSPWRWLDYSSLILCDEITKNLYQPDSKWCNSQSNGSKTKRNLQSLYKNQLSTCLSPLPQ